MEVEAAVRGRRSIRKFTAESIPGALIREILDAARWAPSWGNTQPWEFYVLSGGPLEEFREANRKKHREGAPFATDVPIPQAWPEHMKKRYGEMGRILLSVLDIRREDKEARNRIYEDMAALFGAPCLVVACVPRDVLVEYAMLDVGLVLQTLCLLAHDRGIGTCIMAMAVGHADLLRRIARIPEDRRIIMGVAMGYPRKDAPINRFERRRAEVAEFVRWVGENASERTHDQEKD